MRDGNLIEQHVSDLIWMVHVLDYTGLLMIKTESENLEIYFKNGSLLYDIHFIHPVDVLHRIATSGKGKFVFFDDKELASISREIAIQEDLPQRLIKTSKENSGFPLLLYSREVMEFESAR
ncbi:MAG: DUF4388 domain-containing protein [Caldisericia bacterium]